MPTWSAGDLLNLGKSGVNGGGTVYGGTLASDVLTLQSTTHATKGKVNVIETTAASSTTTGALVVTGGLGVAGTLSTSSLNNAGNLTLGSVNNITLTAPASSATLTIADTKTLTITNGFSLAGTGGSTLDFGSSGGTVTYINSTPAMTSKTLVSPTLTNPTLSGSTSVSSINLVVMSSASASTLTIANGKKLQIDNGLTFTTSGGTPTVAYGGGGTAIYTGGTLGQFATTSAGQLASVITDFTGTAGNVVFSATPTFTGTVTLGNASATTVNLTSSATAYKIGGVSYLTFSQGSAAAPSALLIGPTQATSVPSGATGNTIVGQAAGGASMTSVALNNTLVGNSAGFALTSGTGNTFIGQAAGSSTTTGSQNTAIGGSALVAAGSTGSIALGAGALSTANNEFVIPTTITSMVATGLTTLNTAGSSALTLPVGTATLATTTTAQALSLKTLSSPLFNSPTLGVATATSINGLSVSSTTGTLTVANGTNTTVNETITMTGSGGTVAFGSGGTLVYTGGSLAQFTPSNSATIAGRITDETGSGNLVFSTAPTFTGTLTTTGTASVATLNNSNGYIVGGSIYLTYSSGSAAAPETLLIGPTHTSTVNAGANHNTIIGSAAGGTAMTAIDCTFIGYQTGYNVSSGHYATVIGSMPTAPALTTGILCTFVGATAGEQYAIGNANTCVGYQAGRYSSGGANSDSNTYIGSGAGKGVSGVSSGNANVAVGYHAGNVMTSSANSTLMGSEAGVLISSGNGHTIFGSKAGMALTVNHNTTLVGYKAGFSNAVDDSVFVGSRAGENSVSAGYCTYVGCHAGRYATGGFNTFLGYQAGLGSPGASTGTYNTFLGYQAGLVYTTGGANTCVGLQAGISMTTSGYNTLVGVQAGSNVSTGFGTDGNTFVGFQAGTTVTTGYNNTCIGSGANVTSATSANRIALGYNASATADGQFAIAGAITHLKFAGLETTGTGRLMTWDSSALTIRSNTGVLTNASGTTSSSTTTGTMVVYGGMGISGDLNVGSGATAGAGAAVGFAGSTPTLGNYKNMIFKGTTDQNDWSTVTNLLRVTATFTDSVLVADDYSGGKTLVSLDSANNYGGKVILQPGNYPRCHLFMRDAANFDKMDSTGYNSPIWADTQMGAKLVPSDNTGSAYFGYSTSTDYYGNTLVVGGPLDNTNVGAAWFYNRTATGATFVQVGGGKKVPADVTGTGYVGFSVAMSADNTTAVVGGAIDNSNNGAFWFYNSLGTAVGAKHTVAGNTGAALVGCSVAISENGNTVLIGGRNDNSNVGAAWVFYKSSATVWSQAVNATFKLVGTGVTGAAQFGTTVSVSYDGNTVAIGAPIDNSNVGATWVFTRTNGTGASQTWSQLQPKLIGTGASGGAVNQGFSVALSGDARILAAGAPNDTANGAVWLFEFQGDKYVQLQPKLTSGTALAYFGACVTLSADGTTLVVGTANDTLGAYIYFRQANGFFERRGGLADRVVWTGGTAGGGAGDRGMLACSGLGNIFTLGGYLDNTNVGAVWTFK